MSDLNQLLQYAHKVKVQYDKKRSVVLQELDLLVKSWEVLDKQHLPLAAYAIPEDITLRSEYVVVGADGSPLQLSRHRSIELKALSLARVTTDYVHGTEDVTTTIEDFPEQDELGTLRFPLLELAFATQGQKTDLVLVDGSLVRWQWEQLDQEKKLLYVGEYVDTLVKSYQQKAPVFAVIDRSHSQDIVHWLERQTSKKFRHFTDQDLFEAVLPINTFSPVFRTHSPITDLMPDYNIGFCYYRSDRTVLRIEFVLEQPIDNAVWSYLVDQISKGKGYPWSLVRAHESCVIKETDKIMIEKILGSDGGLSQKELWKALHS
jgi:hypothetical protein